MNEITKARTRVKLSKYIIGQYPDPNDAAAAEKYAFAKIDAAGHWDIMLYEHSGEVRDKSIQPYLEAWECVGEEESTYTDLEAVQRVSPIGSVVWSRILDKDEADILLTALWAYKPRNDAEVRVCVRASAKLEAIRGQD